MSGPCVKMSGQIALEDEGPHEECAVFGIFGADEASAHTTLGLHAMQHRGQEAAGVVCFDGKHFHAQRGLGEVGVVLNKEEVMARLVGSSAIGHNRYATTGDGAVHNIQPLFAEFAFGGFAIAHNGNLTNARSLRRRLVEGGSLFQSTTDTEVIVHLIARSVRQSLVDRLVDALHQVEGAYSLVALSRKKLIGVRDPLGIRPLVLGQLGDAYILASETCALDIIGADFVRDVAPGELIVIDEDGVQSLFPFPKQPSRFCVFEYIYFARPDSLMEGKSVYEARKRIGAELARESSPEGGVDVVVPVPDSGVPAAIGFASAAGVPFEYGIIRNHYVGRTFIEPTAQIRHLGVKLKHNANRSMVEGKRIVLVDDSIVRGTTSRKIVEMMRHAGAAEIHMRISSPPTAYPCYYGIDTPERSELMAARLDVAGMAKEIGVDSLAFISIDGLYRAMGQERRDGGCPAYCDACFTGDYPVRLVDRDRGAAGKRSEESMLRLG
ncbi:MAG: amidophosphoribosyltransferase [Alphaproteobacteria bacterium]|nr:amidophosphoribosyltransferase [Alphaproteobacteria bacterium]MCB9929982.1 amidophosphoribosyltransferase [Alphaproteobacteria bacterium]